jgi:hypothetical protein
VAFALLARDSMSEKEDCQPATAPTRSARREIQAQDGAEGLDHIRDILLGDILAELERRLARLDNYIANRTSELQHDVRHRTDVLEGHVRKELEAVATRATHETSEISAAIRAGRQEQRDVLAQLEQRVSHVEDRLEASIARVEREVREQLLAQAKLFHDEIEQARDQVRSVLVREIGLEPEATEEGTAHASAWTASQ